MIGRISLWTTLGVLLATPVLRAQVRLPVTFLSREEGLPSSQIHDIRADAGGRLWMAGPAGLSSYRGGTVEVYGRRAGLATHGLRAIAILPGGRLAVGSDLGLEIFEPATGRIQRPGRWDFGLVDDLTVATSGRLWAATGSALLAIDPESLAIEELTLDGKSLPLLHDLAWWNGRLAVAADDGVLLYDDGGSWSRIQSPEVERLGAPTALAPTPEGNLLVGAERGLLELARDLSVLRVLATGERIGALLALPDETWLGMGAALHLFTARDGTWQQRARLPETGQVNAMAGDLLGNVWVASDTRGAVKVSVLRKAVQQVEAPCRGGVFSIGPMPGGGFLVGGVGCSWELSPTLSPRGRFPGLDGVRVWDLAWYRGRIVAATETGLAQLEGERLADWGTTPTLRSPGRVLLETEDGLWVGAVGGLALIGLDGRVREVGLGSEPAGYVSSLARGRAGRLWVGTLGRGLWKGEGERFVQVRDELLRDNGNTYAVAISEKGRVAVVQDERIVLLGGPESRSVVPSGLPDVAGWSAVFEGEDRLWVGSGDGLLEIDVPETRVIRRIPPSAGLSGFEFTTSRSLQMSGSHLLCGLDQGLTVVDIEALRSLSDPPRVRGSVQWFPPMEDSEAVSGSPWSLEVRLFSPWLIEEQSLRFSWRLLGGDGLWSGPKVSPQVTLTNLAPGEYTLEARAFSPLTGWGEVSPIYSFRVVRPWWQRWPGWLLLAGVIALAGQRLWSWRSRVLNRRASELEQQVAERTAELEEAKARLEELVKLDGLTGIANYRHFDEVLEREWQRAARYRTSVSLLMLDVDCFKLYNDNYGHLQGDHCLQQIGAILAENCRRPTDLSARWGGEEFAVLLPETTSEGAAVVARQIMQDLRRANLPHDYSSAGDRVTVSIGLASHRPARGQDPTLLVKAADQALYRAKELGRNRIELAP